MLPVRVLVAVIIWCINFLGPTSLWAIVMANNVFVVQVLIWSDFTTWVVLSDNTICFLFGVPRMMVAFIRVVNRLEELYHEHVLLARGSLAKPVEEFGHTNVVLLQELDDGHLLAILHLRLGIQKLGHRNVVYLLIGLLLKELLQELDDSHIDVPILPIYTRSVTVSVVFGCARKVLGHSKVVFRCVHKLGDGDFILLFKQAFDGLAIEEEVGDDKLEEFSHRDVVRRQILRNSGLIGDEEFGDGDIEELGHGDVVCLKEAR